MRLDVAYPSNERVYKTLHTYSVVYKRAHLEPLEVTRRLAAHTQKGNRYFYYGVFKAPADACSIAERDGKKVIFCRIDRKLNRHFDPAKITFNDEYRKQGGDA